MEGVAVIFVGQAGRCHRRRSLVLRNMLITAGQREWDWRYIEKKRDMDFHLQLDDRCLKYTVCQMQNSWRVSSTKVGRRDEVDVSSSVLSFSLLVPNQSSSPNKAAKDAQRTPPPLVTRYTINNVKSQLALHLDSSAAVPVQDGPMPAYIHMSRTPDVDHVSLAESTTATVTCSKGTSTQGTSIGYTRSDKQSYSTILDANNC